LSVHRILILESNWSEDEDYLTDARNASTLYSAIQMMTSGTGYPIVPITRPLLAERFTEDLRSFASLSSAGPNLVVLSGHGRLDKLRRKGGVRNRRVLLGYDGEINISTEVRELAREGALGRTIFLLDSCEVGESPEGFRKAAQALGVIGFDSDGVDWVDSAVFIVALLLKFAEHGVFHMGRVGKRHRHVYEELVGGPYSGLAESLGASASFA